MARPADTGQPGSNYQDVEVFHSRKETWIQDNSNLFCGENEFVMARVLSSEGSRLKRMSPVIKVNAASRSFGILLVKSVNNTYFFGVIYAACLTRI
jgi:hypothetical protein